MALQAHSVKQQEQDKIERSEFDAFVICSPTDDVLEFVKDMIKTFEAPPFKLRFFLPWGNDRAKRIDDIAIVDLIEKSFTKYVVIISKSFYDSDTAKMQLRHAHRVYIENSDRRILPVRIDNSEVPLILASITSLNYCIPEFRVWFWNRLYKSLTLEANGPLRLSSPRVGTNFLPDVVLQSKHFNPNPN